jgi:hypothetical protein
MGHALDHAAGGGGGGGGGGAGGGGGGGGVVYIELSIELLELSKELQCTRRILSDKTENMVYKHHK